MSLAFTGSCKSVHIPTDTILKTVQSPGFDFDSKHIQSQILTSLVGVFLESETLMDKVAVKKEKAAGESVWNHSPY